MPKGRTDILVNCPHCSRIGRPGPIATHIRFEHLERAMVFWRNVRKGDSCWLFKRTDKAGYGRFKRKGPHVYAHRVAWELSYGRPVPAGMDVCHTCDVRNCCNPAHLFLGTAKENMQDCKRKGRHTYGERNKHARLTEKQAIEILRNPPTPGNRWTGSGIKRYAERYGVSRGAIGALLAGRSWKHLSRTAGDRDE